MNKSIKRGSEVVVIAGAHKDKRGKVLDVLKNKDRVVIEGVAMIKKHTKGTQENPEGGIVEREGSIHSSNVMLEEKYEEKRARRK
jgi:large subunit ribosomal protein L24